MNRLHLYGLAAALALGGCGMCGEEPPPPSGGGGGSGGSGGFAGGASSACTGVCGTPGCGSCPAPEVVAGPGFDIDRTEVTRAAYQRWLALVPKPAELPAACAGHAPFTPASGWPPGAAELQLPVVNVHWCAAWSYCHWAKRHLCGALDGGPLDYADYRDAGASEWMAACGPHVFAYGDAYEPAACNTSDANLGAPAKVGSFPGCDGGLPGLLDMSGNVQEWEDSCEAGAGLLDTCHQRGGAYDNSFGFVRCDDPSAGPRGSADPRVGFRCCSP